MAGNDGGGRAGPGVIDYSAQVRQRAGHGADTPWLLPRHRRRLRADDLDATLD